ncbi:related to Vacuolar membrane protein [Ustilago trichophora]|uniref:Related to Vacuolar membrane protein n=1 Tax=Ustilago trichophora TaxID=86804 RepID=A0A5C3DTB4_9BASI|nr:related to Vacuolar membrane protein [Ustilago trichophora]
MSSSDPGLVRLAGVVRDMVPSPSTMAGIMADTLPSPSPSPIIGAPEVDGDNCKLMGPFALFVQAIMGILVIGSLVYKRQREKPKRKWKIWALDVSKQLLGQLFVHILNVVLSDFVASGGGENPCSLYFLNILVDTTVGVFFIYIALKYVTWFLTERLGLEGFVSGQYTPPLPTPVPASGSASSSVHTGASRRSYRRGRPKIEYWFKQLGSYLFVLFLMKMAVLVIFAIFPFLFDVGSWILGFFGNHKDFQVLFSMALFPFAMNVLQFWLIDSLLRHNPYTSAYSKINPDDEEFLNSSDRISQDSRFSGSRPSADASGPSHSIGVASDDEADEHPKRRIQPHASGSGKSRRRPSPQTGASPSHADQPYDYPPPTDLYGSVHKSPPLRPSRPTDEMRRQASLTLSDTGSDQETGTQSIHQTLSASKASLQRSESHHLKQVSTDSSN